MITRRAVWLGGPRRSIFAWLYRPGTGHARAGVVVCPPLGFDYILSHYALRMLAEELANAGFLVVRPDYAGTGDSAPGDEQTGQVESWLATVDCALDTLERSGIERLCLVGMRLGAAFAAEVAARSQRIDQVVLWDPCASGRSFLTQQHAVSTLAHGAPGRSPDGSVEIPGFVLDAETATQLRGIVIGSHPVPLARRVLVLTRSDRPIDPSLCRDSFGRDETTHAEAIGQAALLDRTAPDQELPLAAIRDISRWLQRGTSGRPRPVHFEAGEPQAVVGQSLGGHPVIESPVSIPPVGLFGVLTESEGAKTDHRQPTVMFLNVATEFHIGPARLWVDLARQWAGVGMRVLRLDLSGLGDSPQRHGEDGPWACMKPDAFDDVVDAARWASPDDPSNVVLVGLCASGYQALEGALQLRARGVVAINPYVSFVPPEHEQGLPLDPRRRIVLIKDAIPGTFREGGRLGTLRERVPDLAWRARTLGSPRRSKHWLTDLVRQGTDTLILAGDLEVRPIRGGTSRSRLRKLERTGLLRFDHVPGLQHGLLLASHRRMVAELVSAHVLSRFSGPAAADGPSVAVAGVPDTRGLSIL